MGRRLKAVKPVYFRILRAQNPVFEPFGMVVGLIVVVVIVYFLLKTKETMGRPAVLPKKKKDGFWLEVRNKGSKSGGIILIRDSYEAMMLASRQYQATKDVIILGEHKDGKKVEGARKKKEAA